MSQNLPTPTHKTDFFPYNTFGVIAVIFLFSKRIRRGILFFILLILSLGFLKQNYPQIGAEVNRWITGEKSNPVTKAVSSLVDSLSEEGELRKAVEVFYENIKDHRTD